MKCLNMEVRNVLFFIVNFITVYSANIRHDTGWHQSTTIGNEVFKNKFIKDCPYLLKKITESDLLNYTVDCKTFNMKNLQINEESVLRYACFIVKNISSFMCDKNINVTSDLLKADNYTEKQTSVCPFNFSHLEHLGFTFNYPELVKELTNEVHCSKVCFDLYSVKTQCIVLRKFNKYLKNIFDEYLVPQEQESEQEQEAALAEHTNLKTESIIESTNKEKEQQTIKNDKKEITTKAKNDTEINKLPTTTKNVIKPKKEKKVEKLPTNSTQEEQMSTNEVKPLRKENDKQNNDELKANIDGMSMEFVGEDDLQGSLGESFPVKPELGEERTTQRKEVIKDKISGFSSKGKEIYAGDGFFQAEDSHFFFYFIMVCSIIVVGYLAFHNKNKILAYALEGTSGRRSRRRPNPARYRKLETNLEEAISSTTTNAAASSVVY